MTLTVVVGGARSGKSSYAFARADALPAKEEGLGVSYLESVSLWQLGLGAAGGLGLASTAIGLDVVPAVIAVGFAVAITGVLAIRKIRGISGDVLGATEQVSESAVLLTLV